MAIRCIVVVGLRGVDFRCVAWLCVGIGMNDGVLFGEFASGGSWLVVGLCGVV